MSKRAKISVVGAGLSGLMTSLCLLEKGFDINLISSREPLRSDSQVLRSGFSFVSPESHRPDSIEKHFQETILHGESLADQELCRQMAYQAHQIFYALQALGLHFKQSEEGRPQAFLMDGSFYHRTYFSGPRTASRILQVLYDQILKYESEGRVNFYFLWEMMSIAQNSRGQFCGLLIQSKKNLDIQTLSSDAMVNCSGGFASLYGFSSQSYQANGSSISMLYKKGACLSNLEFINMNPACYQSCDKAISFSSLLKSMQARYWVPKDNKPWYFLEEYYPSLKNQVPTLVTARAIHKITHEKALGIDGSMKVYLDLTQHSEDYFKKNWGSFYQSFKKLSGLDPAVDSIPVSPSFTYTNGGLLCDDDHMTSLPGVFAAGESQSHYHGAQAMEDNIILSSLFGGMRAADGLENYLEGLEESPSVNNESLINDEALREHQKTREFLDKKGSVSLYESMRSLSQVMTKSFGLKRKNENLIEAIDQIREMKELDISLPDLSRNFNQSFFDARHFYDCLDLAEASLFAALYRNESRAFHYKVDHPDIDNENFSSVSRLSYNKKGPLVEKQEPSRRYLKLNLENISSIVKHQEKAVG